MKRKIVSLFLVLLMVFPLVFTTVADTAAQSEIELNDPAALSATGDNSNGIKSPDPNEVPDELIDPEDIGPVVPGNTCSDIWAEIDALEASAISGRKGAPAAGAEPEDLIVEDEPQKLTAVDFANMTDDVEQMVLDWDGYVAGSLVRNGDVLFWEGEDGIPYGYFPDAREKLYNAQLAASTGGDHNRPRVLCYDGQNETEIPANQISSIEFNKNDVAVFGPLYHIDEAFADEDEDSWCDAWGTIYGESYYAQGKKIANKINAINTVIHGASYCNFTDNMAHCYVFTQSAASVDMIAQALLKCRVVFIDTHGTTEYFNDGEGGVYDKTSGANTSYIMLTSDNLVTDYNWYTGAYKGEKDQYGNYTYTYRHAKAGTIKCNGRNVDIWCVDGTTIRAAADALNWPFEGTTDNAPFVWLGSCYGMATEGLCNPLLAMGAGVVYGYTKAVSFKYDAKCGHHFWNAMLENNAANVSGSAQTMKDEAGECDNYKNDDFYDPDGNPTEVWQAHPWFASYDQPYPNYRLPHGANQGMVMSTWQIVENMWAYPDPTDGPVTPGGGVGGTVYTHQQLDPMGFSQPNENYLRTYYRGYYGTEGNGFLHSVPPKNMKFLRYEWEVTRNGGDITPTKAYAVFACGDAINYLYNDPIKINGKDYYVLKNTDGLDEKHHACLKIEVQPSQNANGHYYAYLPQAQCPDNHNGGYSESVNTDTIYWEVLNGSAWVFDHWEFEGNTGDPDSAEPVVKAVYFNKWDGNQLVFSSDNDEILVYRASDGNWKAELKYEVYYCCEGDLGIKRTTVIPWDGWRNNWDWSSGGNHYWIYDGVVPNSWDFRNFNPETGEGAKVTVQYHCVHGCGHTEQCTVKAYVTKKDGNAYTFTAFIGPTQGFDSFKEYGGLDNWMRFESISVTIVPPTPTPTPTPMPTPTPTPHEHTYTVVGWIWHKADSWDEPDDNTRFCDLRAEAEFGCECGAHFGEIAATIVLDSDKPAHTYKAYVKKDPSGKSCYYEDERCYPNIHNWVFDGFYDTNNWEFDGLYENATPWRGGKDAIPFYHCSSCNERPGEDWFYECLMSTWFGSSWVSVWSENDGYPDHASLWVVRIGASVSLDGQEHRSQGICGQSDEWEFDGFDIAGSKAYAVYLCPNRITTGLGDNDGSCAPPFIEVEDYEWTGGDYSYSYLKIKIKAQLAKTKYSRFQYVAIINREQSADGERHESDPFIPTPTAIPLPSLKPRPTDVIAPPTEMTLDPRETPGPSATPHP